MANFTVETTVEIYSPKDCKFRAETTIKCKNETAIEGYSQSDWKFRVKTTMQFKAKVNKRTLKMEFLVVF